MKKIIIILLAFISHSSFASINEKSKADTIVLSIEKHTKQAIDKYNNFFYLFPYITIFDKQYLTGKEVINKHSLTDTLTTATFSTEDEYYIIQCITLKKEVEVLVKRGDLVKIRLIGDEIQITVSNRNTENCEFKVDEILYLKNINPTDLTKRYLNPLHFMSFDEALKFPNRKFKVKNQAFIELPHRIVSSTNIVDSIQRNGLSSDITANFYKNKFKNQYLALSILESRISFDSCKILLKEFSNSKNLYPDRYNYRVAERIVDKFFVENAKEIKFNDFTNRDYCEIYDKINLTDIFETRYKNHLLARELERIISSFPKNIGKGYYDKFLSTTSDTILHKIMKENFSSIFELSDNKTELLSENGEKYSLTGLASRSKYTFVDFWASWCGPCRAEMPNSKKLEEIYVKKGINFIYISTDKRIEAWKKASRQIGLSQNQSFYLVNGDESKLSKKYKIATIPRYMLIDEKRQFINQNAPRPSDPKIRQIFDELLKKK